MLFTTPKIAIHDIDINTDVVEETGKDIFLIKILPYTLTVILLKQASSHTDLKSRQRLKILQMI